LHNYHDANNGFPVGYDNDTGFGWGTLEPGTIRSSLVRDRGDGRRGSTNLPGVGKVAVTHFEIEQRMKGHTLLSCRLETGRTHQIRIHLSESGHPVCGDKVYGMKPNGQTVPDASGAPRLMLHVTEFGFVHPVTGAELHWSMPMPRNMVQIVERWRG